MVRGTASLSVTPTLRSQNRPTATWHTSHSVPNPLDDEFFQKNRDRGGHPLDSYFDGFSKGVDCSGDEEVEPKSAAK